ncbi:MAG: hypothetical protein ACLFUG_11325 [Nitriliruptoraceae bacterium]
MTAPEIGEAPTVGADAGAIDRDTSPDRRDWVKPVWEEPELTRLLDAAVRATGPAAALDVLDVGCGTGGAHPLTATVVTRPGG